MERRVPLPESMTVDELSICRWTSQDAPDLHALILANVEHLRPRMPWIADEPQSLEQRRKLIDGWSVSWAEGGDMVGGIWRDETLVGSLGLHWRGEPDGPEIGYWVAEREQGQGIATRASAALVDLAFTVPEIGAVYLANDSTNVASRRVPEKLGFAHIGQVPVPADKVSPADSGVNDRWRMDRADWSDRT